MHQKMGKKHCEYGIAGNYNSCSIGIQVHYTYLEEGHAEADSQYSQKSHIAPVHHRQGNLPALKLPDGQRKKEKTSDKEPEKVHLQGSEGAAPYFERHFHGSKAECSYDDIKNAPLRHLPWIAPMESHDLGHDGKGKIGCHAILQEMIPQGCNHSPVVTAKFHRGDIDLHTLKLRQSLAQI